jgi:NADPH:quinone reductase-like Zn-dependent oxidoreductase
MRAVRFDRYGAADVLSVRDLARPTIAAGQVLVRIAAASINPKDTFVRKGRFRHFTGTRFPLASGYDGSGVVVESAASAFQAGDHVFGMLNGWHGGAAADFVAWPAKELAFAPRTIPLSEAAAIPLAGLTALQALRDHLRVKPAQRVLINGASGGVGTFAVQIARALGARVTAVCSAARAEHVLELGAETVHDYSSGPLPPSDFDSVFDVFGNLSARAAAEVTLAGARYVTTVPSRANFRAALALWRRPRTRIVVVRSRAADLETLAAMVDARKLRVIIDARFDAADVAAAHRHIEGKHTIGKVLLDFAGAGSIE